MKELSEKQQVWLDILNSDNWFQTRTPVYATPREVRWALNELHGSLGQD